MWRGRHIGCTRVGHWTEPTISRHLSASFKESSTKESPNLGGKATKGKGNRNGQIGCLWHNRQLVAGKIYPQLMTYDYIYDGPSQYCKTYHVRYANWVMFLPLLFIIIYTTRGRASPPVHYRFTADYLPSTPLRNKAQGSLQVHCRLSTEYSTKKQGTRFTTGSLQIIYRVLH